MELDTRPGPTRDRVVEVLNSWRASLRQCLLDAQASREIDPRADVDQAVFEVQAMLFAANFLFVMTNDPIRLTQARRGVESVLARFAVGTKPRKRRSHDLVPKDIYPVVEIEFPAKEPNQPPVTRRYVLKERC